MQLGSQEGLMTVYETNIKSVRESTSEVLSTFETHQREGSLLTHSPSSSPSFLNSFCFVLFLQTVTELKAQYQSMKEKQASLTDQLKRQKEKDEALQKERDQLKAKITSYELERTTTNYQYELKFQKQEEISLSPSLFPALLPSPISFPSLTLNITIRSCSKASKRSLWHCRERTTYVK
jgi:FtsZ-binding cell division protein ZapB